MPKTLRLTFLISIFTSSLMRVTMAQVHYIKEMNTEEIHNLDRETTVVLLSGGILEEHGPICLFYSECFSQVADQPLLDNIHI